MTGLDQPCSDAEKTLAKKASTQAPGLIRKYYLLVESVGKAGAVYLWETRP